MQIGGDVDNWLTLVLAVSAALVAVVALRFIEHAANTRLGPEPSPDIAHKFEEIVGRVRVDYETKIAQMQERHAQEIAKLQREYEQKVEALQQRVDWLFSQLVSAGVKVPDAELSSRKPITGEVEKPTVLGVWPSSDLSIRAEIDAIYRSGTKYEVLDSNVTRPRLLDEVDRLRPVILHVGAHASKDGVMLDDGIAPIGYWRNLATIYPFSLVVLNACESLEIVDAMHDAGALAVVGMRKDISDKAAIAFAKEFYNWLARGRAVQAAVVLAKMSLEQQDAELVKARGDWNFSIGRIR